MLPRPARLTSPRDFRRTVRRGVRVGRPTVIVHAAATASDAVRVGFVVSRAVGNAVTRNTVRRRLRHLALAELARTPSGTDLVLRAQPRAAKGSELAADVHAGWRSALDRLAARASSAGPGS